jgi:hypothetical protein
MLNNSPAARIDFDDGTVMYAEIEGIAGGRQLAGANLAQMVGKFDAVTSAVRNIAKGIKAATEAVSPDKTTVEMKFAFTMGTDGIAALLVKGEGSGSIKIILQWNKG